MPFTLGIQQVLCYVMDIIGYVIEPIHNVIKTIVYVMDIIVYVIETTGSATATTAGYNVGTINDISWRQLILS